MHQGIIRKDLALFKVKPHLENYEESVSNFDKKALETNMDFYSDGKTNIALDVIDKHIKTNKKDKIALVYIDSKGEKKEYSFLDIFNESNKFANLLKDLGVRKGDRVFIFLPTIPERYIAFLGILKLGAIAGTMFSAFQESALQDRLSDSEAKIVITDSNLYPRIKNIKKKLPHLKKIILISNNDSENEDVINYHKELNKKSNLFNTVHLSKDDFAYMLYTSGTTGKPKGVVHTHGDVSQAMITTKIVLDVKEDDIYWCTADMGWVTGIVYGLIGIWGLGGTSVIYGGRFSPKDWYEVLEKTKTTIWYTAPTAIRMLMGSGVDLKKYDFSNLRHIASVGEPLNPEGVWWMNEQFGIPAHDSWWQTETGSIAISNYASMDIKPGSMGKPFPGIKAAIINHKGNEMEAGNEGDLALDPKTLPSLMKTIWKNNKKFESYFSNGWYISGDRAYKDEDGYFWFVGRLDDVVNTSGERIGPFEIESVLIEHSDIVEAGVIGKPDKLRGEIIKAYVVLRSSATGTEELKNEIIKYVKHNFSGHAYPREIEFVEKLPKTRSGKIMRRVLKARGLGLPEGDLSTLEDY